MYLYHLGNHIRNLTGAADFHLPGGSRVRVGSTQRNPFLEFSGEIVTQTEDTLELRMIVRNIGNDVLYIDTLYPGVIDTGSGGATSLGLDVQSWTMLSGGIGAGVRDLCDLCFAHKVRDFYAVNYAMFGKRSAGEYFFCGFKNSHRQETRVELHAEVVNCKFKNLLLCCDLAGYELRPGAELSGEVLTLRIGSDPAELMMKFADELADLYGKKEFRNIVGWSGWDFYQQGISEKDVLENVEYLARHRDTLPVEYIQLDDGYEIRDGDWLLANKKFPRGLKYLADRIHAAGFKAGLWLNPFLAAPESQVVREHPEWLLRGKTGEPVILNGYAVREIYGLDCSVPGVNDYLRELARTVTVDYGFDYLKFDGANRQVLTSLGYPSDAKMGRAEVMYSGLAAFKSGMRRDAILLNGSTFGIAMGIADAMRVGEDAGGRWDASLIAKDHGERDRFNGAGEVLRAIAAADNHFYLHKKVWVNDPDYLVVRQAGLNSELSLEEARSWASVVALSNGSIILADPPGLLTEERLEIVEKILPHCQYPARPVDFFRKNVPSVLIMRAENASEHYWVASVTNTDLPKRVRDYELDFAELGLECGRDYLVFEFWNSAFCGEARDHFTVRGLPPHSTRVFALRRKTGRLQLLGTDSHISMGGIDVESFDGKTLKVRRRGKPWRAFFYLPEGMTPPRKLRQISPCCYCLDVPENATVIGLE